MAQSSWPFENIDTNETQFSQWARNIGEGVKTGALNELEVFADSTGMQVKIRSGQALVRGHYYQNTAEVTLTLEAADATNSRIDIVVLELDPSANTITLQIITGVAESSPSPEPVVQTDAGIYQIKLAEIAVGSSVTTITAGNVTDTRFYIEEFQGTVPGSAITGEITAATMDGDRLFNQIDSATIPAGNVTNLDVAAVTGLQTELDAKQPLTPSVNAKSANYTLTADDRGEFVTCDGTFTITIPDATFSAGDRVDFVNIGTGVITFTGSGVTVNSVDDALTIDTQYAGATFFFTSASTGVLIGRLA